MLRAKQAPAETECPHPPARQRAHIARAYACPEDDAPMLLTLVCCECGAVLRGGAEVAEKLARENIRETPKNRRNWLL